MIDWILKGAGLALVAYHFLFTAEQPELARNIILGTGVALYFIGSIVRVIKRKKEQREQ